MKFISWNVNGFRACLQKGFEEFFNNADADIFCLQETKMQPGQADFSPAGYHIYYHSAVKKGYSGTAVFTKTEPLSVTYGINGEHTDEGRVITCEFEKFYFVCCYVPNAQDGLKRIDYRMEFEDAMRGYLSELDRKKPVVYCGDLNVAHNEIDLKNYKTNVGNAGFSDEERGKFTELLAAGFTDTFRKLYPDTAGVYSWWSYRFNARKNNAGWRIDYFVVSDRFMEQVEDSQILTDVYGSDHCPVMLLTKEL
ncbi:exodeoxyribonuclease III [uncultured Ruminococcus sp.]|uniref:exodeoxyribonuclease III n=1 Tax=uncultured Ruminococcus sp. TaxID=165186 RepID=UPI0026106F33|nr:exodeoxyribonuclease III [uncultured Ruminococcus sp.]